MKEKLDRKTVKSTKKKNQSKKPVKSMKEKLDKKTSKINQTKTTQKKKKTQKTVKSKWTY